MQISIEEVVFEAATLSGDNTFINMQVASRWVMEAIRQIGIFHVLDQKTKMVTIENYTADMPIDFYRLIDVGTGQQYIEHGYNLNVAVPTITISNCILRANFKDGEIAVTYMAFPVDEQNRPVIDEDYYEPVKQYLISKFLEIRLMARPELIQMKQYYDAEFSKSAGAVRAEKMMPTNGDLRRIIRERKTFY